MVGHPSPEGAHHIHVCTACRNRETDELRGVALLALLAEAATKGDLPDGFTVSGINCMAGCAHPCTVGFQSAGKAAWLFGDLLPEDLADLLAFAQLYHALPDGWSRSTERPGKMAHAALARIPAGPASGVTA
ncbi:Predicted metal-binding protein [Pseudorhodobacter antarcticus]|jgi:predicted metal-binding protein|uniref:Predicted metal-binding protein n=1 Tax=Pseudorhodobacter antarcticus TaxID=1077947 RepID=A0A1H8LFD0_9RHOB|nr:DUF1636 family protein [Pseudorhodobacter antarcticus]SEO03506.1 Predicted metal-binding protein [Pseudorhodobacter antarcticus]